MFIKFLIPWKHGRLLKVLCVSSCPSLKAVLAHWLLQITCDFKPRSSLSKCINTAHLYYRFLKQKGMIILDYISAKTVILFKHFVSSSNRLMSLFLFCHDRKQMCNQTNTWRQIKMPSIVTTQLGTCFLIHGLSIHTDLAQVFPSEAQMTWD